MVTKRKAAVSAKQNPFDFFREHVEVVNISDEPTSRPSKCPNCPHPMKGIHHYKTGKCKMCSCEGPAGDVKGGYASALAASGVPEKHRKRIAKQTEGMPKPMADIMSTDLGGDFGSMLSRDFKRITKKGKKR